MADAMNITRAEMEIINYIMDHQPVTVRRVTQAMSSRRAGRSPARTTVLTLMERLRAKRWLTRQRSPDGFVYSLRVSKAALLRNLVGDFVTNALGGSMSPFVAYLTEQAKLTDRQAEELRKIIDQMDEREKSK